MTMTPAVPPGSPSALALLFGSANDAPASLPTVSAKASAELGRALENLPMAAREIALNEVRTAAAEVLDINLIDLLLAGWRQYRDLTSAARRTLAAPGSSELVRLVTHRVTAVQQPHVNVLVNGHLVATVEFSISLVFDVSALLAGISAGLLVAVHAGQCDITATLAIDGVDVATRQAHLDLPGVIPLTPGVRLLPARDYPSDTDPALIAQRDRL